MNNPVKLFSAEPAEHVPSASERAGMPETDDPRSDCCRCFSQSIANPYLGRSVAC